MWTSHEFQVAQRIALQGIAIRRAVLEGYPARGLLLFKAAHTRVDGTGRDHEHKGRGPHNFRKARFG